MPCNHLILCHSLLLPPSIFHSIRVFSNESVLHIRGPKDWRFSFSISPSNEYSGLISFRMDWLDLLVVQGTLKSLFQYHSSKASVLQCSAFFIVQLSHPYMTTWKRWLKTQHSENMYTLLRVKHKQWGPTIQHRELYSVSLNNRVTLSEKWKSKPQWGTIAHQSGWLLSKSLQAINAGEGVEKRDPSYTVGGNAN